MIKALAIKELREILGIAAIGFGAQILFGGTAVGIPPFDTFARRETDVPFVDSTSYGFSCFLAGMLAVALGFRQAAWENSRGTYQFLLHRPIRRDKIFLTKLGTGLAVFLICTGVPILLRASWAAVPGTHPSPFYWSMTERYWQMCLVVPLVYAGSFLAGLRPGKWFGTRTFPLAGTGLLAAPLLVVGWPWLLGLPVLIVIYAVLVGNICFVGRMRDYS
jgi:hypothetical protein